MGLRRRIKKLFSKSQKTYPASVITQFQAEIPVDVHFGDMGYGYWDEHEGCHQNNLKRRVPEQFVDILPV